MYPPQEPSTCHMILQIINAFPSRLGTWTVKHPKQSSGYDLGEKNKGQAATPDISPPSSTWYFFIQCFFNQSPNSRTVIDPIHYAFNHTGTFSAMFGRNCWKRIQITPSSTFVSIVSIPRGLGLLSVVTEPSSANVLLWHGQK